jgi:hypothetical protein
MLMGVQAKDVQAVQKSGVQAMAVCKRGPCVLAKAVCKRDASDGREQASRGLCASEPWAVCKRGPVCKQVLCASEGCASEGCASKCCVLARAVC